MLGIEQNLNMTVSGFIFLGGMEAFIFVPLMPILIESLLIDFKERNTAFKKLSEKDNEQIEELMTDKASSIFQGAQAIGCIIGPIMGGYLNDLYKFQTTCDVMAFTCLVYAGFLYIASFRKLPVAPKSPLKFKSVDMIEMSFISKKTASDL